MLRGDSHAESVWRAKARRGLELEGFAVDAGCDRTVGARLRTISPRCSANGSSASASLARDLEALGLPPPGFGL